MTRKVILEDKDGEELVPYTELATNQQPGRVRPDGSSLIVDSNGIMSVSGATGTEIGYLSGVTSSIQGQLNANTSLVETTRQNLQTEINTKANSTDVSNATLTITQGGVSKGTFTANASSDVTIALDSGGGSDRNIGEIVTSTIPLTDAGLHLLDGALISGSGSYADFVTYIAGLVSDYPDLFETEANWQTSVTNFGSCEKFVYDSVNNTVRLPKRVTEHGYLVKSYSNGADWYRIYSDGWCEQGSYSNTSAAGTKQINLIVSYKDTDYMIYITSAANNSASGHTFHAIANTQNKTVSSFYTSLNEYYGTSTVIGYWKTCGYINLTNYKNTIYEYIVLATSTKTDIEVDIDEIATDLNGKADVDLSNCTKPHIIETYSSGTNWYRIYSDGWCEQGGQTSQFSETVTLLKEMADTNYSVSVTCKRGKAPTAAEGNPCGYASSTTQAFICSGPTGVGSYWEVRGYISQGV